MVHHLLDGVVSGETGVETHHLVGFEVPRTVVRRHVEKFLRRDMAMFERNCATQVDPHAAPLAVKKPSADPLICWLGFVHDLHPCVIGKRLASLPGVRSVGGVPGPTRV